MGPVSLDCFCFSAQRNDETKFFLSYKKHWMLRESHREAMINCWNSGFMKREFFIAKTDAALAVIVLMVAFYLCVCVAVLLNNRIKEANQTVIISNDRAKFELAHSFRHDAAFFRML